MSQMYEIHLYVPKHNKLTPKMIDWLYENGARSDLPEIYWPIRKIRVKALARALLRLDPTLRAFPSAQEGDVELHYPDETMGIVLYVHDRGVIVFFPYLAYGVYSRVVLGICYTYIRFLYELAGFWHYDPQLNRLGFADDYLHLERVAVLMDKVMPRLLGE
jgi:hypothetical protein